MDTCFTFKSLNRLLKVDLTALSLPTIQKLTALHDNYHADTSVKEEYSIRDLIEITNFVDALFETRTMQTAQKFLQTKNLPNGRDNFLEMWFGLYQRGAENSSSGFEHVFLGEIIKGKEVSGLHNWVFFNREEKSKLLDYMGHMSFTCLGTVCSKLIYWKQFVLSKKQTKLSIITSFILMWSSERKLNWASIQVERCEEAHLIHVHRNKSWTGTCLVHRLFLLSTQCNLSRELGWKSIENSDFWKRHKWSVCGNIISSVSW